MSTFLIGVFIVIAIVSRLREAMKDGKGDRLGDVARQAGRLIPDSVPDEAPASLSLQQVLAEIQKVKAQSERAPETMQAGSARDQIRRAALTQERKQELAERAERKRRESAAARNPESVRPLVRTATAIPEPATLDIQADGAASRVVPDSPTSQAGAAATVSPGPRLRLNATGLRDAFVWREILSLPVSLRDEPPEQS